MRITFKAPLVCTVLVGAISLFNSGCKSYDVASRYTAKHIKAHTNQVSTNVPETGELGYILLSLTDAAKSDSSILNKNTAYYKEVAQHFAAFKSHKAVKQLNADITQDPATFTHFRNGLYALKINDRNRIVLRTDYRIDLNRLDFKRYTSVMEDFMVKSKFREFYAQHANLYAKLVQNQSRQLTMNTAWASMGKHYNQPFQSYQVVISPLMKGYSSSLAIGGRGFRECIIFTESADKALMYSAAKNKLAEQTAFND
jgi:hypothetical protein